MKFFQLNLKNTQMAINSSSFFIVCAIFVFGAVTCNEKSWFLLDETLGTDLDLETIGSKMRYKVYTGPSMKHAKILDVPVQKPEKLFHSIDPEKPVVLYIHGFRENPSSESIRTVVEAHLKRGTDNIIVLDWSELAFENYIRLVLNRVFDIAKVLTASFDHLVELGLDLEAFHVVGHSLGSQIAGFMGKFSENSIPRITGLDPAGPGFYHYGAEHIDATSARFVDIIHTDAGFYGALTPTGTVDFFANGGGRPQPGCSLIDLCNHQRSWRYYAESVLNEQAFVAVQCGSYAKFLLGECASNRRTYVGYATPSNVRGSFYFSTNDKPPYSKNSQTHTKNHLET